jgi:hypothetical protein
LAVPAGAGARCAVAGDIAATAVMKATTIQARAFMP